MPAPTVRSIAAAAGVSHETVARALRNDPRVAAATRERIVQLADRMGYRVNPLIQALMRTRSAGRSKLASANVAFLKPISESGDYWGLSPFSDQVDGCFARFSELGFTASPLEIPEGDVESPNLMRIIRARGIHGLVIGSMPQGHRRLNVCAEELAMVACGLALEYPLVSRVSSDFAGNLRMAMSEVAARGYLRPGLVMRPDQDERREFLPTSVWEYIQRHEWRAGQRIPVYQGAKKDEAAFGKWLDKYRPDVILGMDHDVYMKFLRTRRKERGDEIDFLHLEAPEGPDDFSGVRTNNFEIGQISAEVLAQLMLHNEYGLPTRRLTTLLQPVWREGSALRPR